MDSKELLNVIAAALTSVTDPHYYEDERGFQGEFYAQLRLRLRDLVLPEGALLREEYQKRLAQHGLRIRPDIILHEPFDLGRHRGRDQGNHSVMELKRRATRGTAADALSNLVAMIDTLNYPLGVFINIDSSKTWTESVPDSHRDRIVCLAAHLDENGKPQVVRG
ncbi:hypothetical protein [Stenotrophomonas maltophilia]|uniref:hypothetical protein n=1 Tax=Stenotrophomonas maltophilia TaxID=40324 RepID=UPI003B9FB676